MKKQLDGGMLWRRLAEQKRGGTASTTTKKGDKSDDWQEKKVNGKKIRDMSPDERVEAMIQLGMI